jgi:hypothetical protein
MKRVVGAILALLETMVAQRSVAVQENPAKGPQQQWKELKEPS